MKKRNKKYNPYKNAEIITDSALKNLYVAFVTGKDEVCVIVNKKGELIEPTTRLYKAIAKVKHKWSVYMSVFGFQADGKGYSKSEVVNCQQRYFQSDLVEFLNDEHKKLVAGFNKSQMAGAGWLASPAGVELTEQEAGFLFDKLGAWD